MSPTPESVLLNDRRHYFRITITLPVTIQLEGGTDRILTQKSVNLSGGGIGFLTNTAYAPGDILMVAIQLPGQYFKSSAGQGRHDEVAKQDARIRGRDSGGLRQRGQGGQCLP